MQECFSHWSPSSTMQCAVALSWANVAARWPTMKQWKAFQQCHCPLKCQLLLCWIQQKNKMHRMDFHFTVLGTDSVSWLHPNCCYKLWCWYNPNGQGMGGGGGGGEELQQFIFIVVKWCVWITAVHFHCCKMMCLNVFQNDLGRWEDIVLIFWL